MGRGFVRMCDQYGAVLGEQSGSGGGGQAPRAGQCLSGGMPTSSRQSADGPGYETPPARAPWRCPRAERPSPGSTWSRSGTTRRGCGSAALERPGGA